MLFEWANLYIPESVASMEARRLLIPQLSGVCLWYGKPHNSWGNFVNSHDCHKIPHFRSNVSPRWSGSALIMTLVLICLADYNYMGSL